ncbi:transcriptional regulator with XRE-family HTH domain [Psychromicrobium silvestre]|uniref:Transcriptional regulator with XRE-family HTH domain n=1 Tax=Psychromicrobium silvestre TaxID=1645614 RepID=A0A7Y9LSS1_9MICC|nr:helix-turn-helix transcriptional regulator [Psychromicrobium silvestre]NYE94916.1 transcriptional regulator with XRE-family HTH domain [Psychromicrobium silvestre]
MAEPLLREVHGLLLRRARLRQGRKLEEVAAAAGISMQYLSEIERGRKEPSSEVLAAVCGGLGTTVAMLTRATHRQYLELRIVPEQDFSTAPGLSAPGLSTPDLAVQNYRGGTAVELLAA